MTIKEFLQTENGFRFKKALRDCDDRWHVTYYDDFSDYQEELKANGWSDEDIDEQMNLILANVFRADHDHGIVVVGN